MPRPYSIIILLQIPWVFSIFFFISIFAYEPVPDQSTVKSYVTQCKLFHKTIILTSKEIKAINWKICTVMYTKVHLLSRWHVTR